ncbi:MAG: PQQ-binding-like beta-propeller repeat protein, partial [Acidobacteria bacterium]|nr:PQQ-binding-like beta-propeller repeat protein [Acidobacteriota bacterium]
MGDWPDWRGPGRDGISSEKGLPTQWSPSGENLAWRVPYGGRSAPIVIGDHVYLQNSAGEGETLQERVMCFHADTGKLLWEHRFNVYLSDVPPHRVGWASPAGDPETGNIYVFGVGGSLLALSRHGKRIWERSLSEDFGLISTHGGRTVSPVVEGQLVIVSGINSGWGNQARGGHRFMAFDKHTGETVWVSLPGGRPYDTTYSTPIGAVIHGTRLLIAGGGDGAVHAIRPQTGEKAWSFEMSKRGINTGVVLHGGTAFVSHGEENLDTSEMGMLAAIDATASGELGKDKVKWARKGFLGGYSSPVVHGNRLYQTDNGANLAAFDVATGEQLWTLGLGTIQKASPVLADGKLYVGTENGKFFILAPRETGCDILDQDVLGTEESPEEIIGSVAVSHGRIFLASREALYCIGKKKPDSGSGRSEGNKPSASAGEVAHVQVVPTELVLAPGETVKFQARLFDGQGRFVREGEASWSLEQLTGKIEDDGKFTASAERVAQAGLAKATVGNFSGAARVRVIPPLPWDIDFESMAEGPAPRHWINATGKFTVRQAEESRVLVKLADNPFTRRARAYMGPSDWSDYTVEADFRSTDRRRQLGDAGLVAQRYSLLLFGYHQ